MTLTIIATDSPTAADREAILTPLLAFNDGQAGPSGRRPLALLLRDDAGVVVGGLSAWIGWRWMFIELLAVPDGSRHQGLGTRLMQQAEAAARVQDCLGIWLDTFSFQARPFYEALGYAAFGEIDDYPPGQSRYFMKKRLDR